MDVLPQWLTTKTDDDGGGGGDDDDDNDDKPDDPYNIFSNKPKEPNTERNLSPSLDAPGPPGPNDYS